MPAAPSFDSDVGLLDHRAPALEVGADLRGEFLGLVAHRIDAQHAEALAHLGLVQHGGDLALQPVHDGPRRFRRREDADPGIDDEAGQAAFDEGRHIGRAGGALRARQAEPLQAPALHELLRARHRRADERNLAAHRVGQRLAAALVGHVHEAGAGALAQHLAGEVRAGAGAGRTVGQRARLGLAERDQFAQVLHRQRRVRDHDHAGVADFRHRREIAQHVETGSLRRRAD